MESPAKLHGEPDILADKRHPPAVWPVRKTTHAT